MQAHKPLFGKKAIAKHLGVSEKKLDRWRNKYSDIPVTKMKDGGLMAIPIKLYEWFEKVAESEG